MSGTVASDGMVEAFVTATRVSLEEMAGLNVIVRSVSKRGGTWANGDVVAVVGLTWGYLELHIPSATARTMAAGILEGVASDPDEALVQDCMGEVANVIAGQAKTLLAETPHAFTFLVPEVAWGRVPLVPEDFVGERCVITFGSAPGDFALQLLVASSAVRSGPS
jgi:CheY-specific phosphatase CheX